jgi:hypothetical protein
MNKRWVGHVACMGERRRAYQDLVGKPQQKGPLGRNRHMRIILKLILKNWDGVHGLD